MTAPQTYTVDQAAEILHVTPDWLRRRLCERRLPGRKLGRTWVLTDADIQQALDIAYREATTVPADPSGLSTRSRTTLNRKAGK